METPSCGRITIYCLKSVSLNSKHNFFWMVSFKLKLGHSEVLIFKVGSLKRNGRYLDNIWGDFFILTGNVCQYVCIYFRGLYCLGLPSRGLLGAILQREGSSQ
jgi:hypothetical protein